MKRVLKNKKVKPCESRESSEPTIVRLTVLITNVISIEVSTEISKKRIFLKLYDSHLSHFF